MLVYGGDDVAAAIDDALASYDLAVRANNRTSRSGMASVLAHLKAFRAGDYAEAKRWADASLEIAEVIGNVTTVRTAAAVALGARHELGETVDAGRDLRPLEDGFAMASNLSLYARLIVDVLLSVGEVALAERAARLAYERAGGRLRDLLARQALGDVLTALGPAHYAEAANCFEQVGGSRRAWPARDRRAREARSRARRVARGRSGGPGSPPPRRTRDVRRARSSPLRRARSAGSQTSSLPLGC